MATKIVKADKTAVAIPPPPTEIGGDFMPNEPITAVSGNGAIADPPEIIEPDPNAPPEPMAVPVKSKDNAKPKEVPKKYDPSRRATVVRDEFGKREGVFKRAVNLGLSAMILPPLTKRTTATYRVIHDDTKINRATGQPADLQPITLPGTYMLYDKFDPDPSNRSKEMRNATGRKERIRGTNGQPDQLVDVVEWVDFYNGVIKVNVESQYRLYVFLELHPLNKSNRNRPNVQPMFERIDIQFKSETFRVAQEELADEAMAAVRDLNDKDKIIGYAASAGIPTIEHGKMREVSLIKSDLRALAYKDPQKFFSLSNNFGYAVKMTVLDALGLGIIDIEHDRRRVMTPYTDEPLFTYLPGIDPVEQFVEFLKDTNLSSIQRPDSDNPDDRVPIYDVIKNMLDFWTIA